MPGITEKMPVVKMEVCELVHSILWPQYKYVGTDPVNLATIPLTDFGYMRPGQCT